MKNFITIFLVLVFAAAIGWYFMPEGWRGKISGVASVALRGDRQEVKKYFKDIVLPQNPEKRRTVLLGELKKNLAEVKKEGMNGLAGQSFISAVEEIVKDLEEANHDKSISQEVTERVFDKIFPAKSEVVQCKNKNQ